MVAANSPSPSAYISSQDQLIAVQYIPSVPLFVPTEDGECVSFVKANGFDQYFGDAETWDRYINSSEPEVGSVVVLKEGPNGHLALVLEVRDTEIDIVEQNFEENGVISYRTLSKNYSRIVGYVRKPSITSIQKTVRQLP